MLLSTRRMRLMMVTLGYLVTRHYLGTKRNHNFLADK